MSRAPKPRASTNSPAESPAKPQGSAGRVAAPDAVGGGAQSPAVVAPEEAGAEGAAAAQAPSAGRVILLCNVHHDGEALAEGTEVTLPAEVARQLVATGAAELDD